MHPPNYQRTTVYPETRAINDDGSVLHLITSASEDRMGDVVDPAGAKTNNFKQNPVVLADHDYSIQSIIGRATEIGTSKEGLFARTEFQTETQLGRDAFALVQAGFAKAWSIGFRPIKWDTRKEKKGFHFHEWELLEYSLVAVPANADITMAMQKGLLSAEGANVLIAQPEQAEPSDEAPTQAKAEPEAAFPVTQRAIDRAIRILERRHAAREVEQHLGQRGLL